MSALQRENALFTHIDPFSDPVGTFRSLLRAVLATAAFRCWYLIIFFSGWATAVCLISDKVHHIGIQPTILTVLGTVLGFVISYRTSSSFDRYNEGRRLWSSVILGARTFSRFIWFHVPDTWAPIPGEELSQEEMQARTIIEKKTAINLIEAFAVAIKHYLRGEEGIYYEDLYHLVKYLPAYDLPRGMPPTPQPQAELALPDDPESGLSLHGDALELNHSTDETTLAHRRGQMPPGLPQPKDHSRDTRVKASNASGPLMGEPPLLPSRNPPKHSLFDLFPFSLLGKYLARKGYNVGGKKQARKHAKTRVVSHNVPLEITLYLSSYVAVLQRRKVTDVPTLNGMFGALQMLTDSLTGLERVLTTPIPFSYSIHLWSVTIIFIFCLPFQLWTTLHYVTIPATSIASFFFFGFLAAGEEIENPFGYDKNDLNMDHFCHNIIRRELESLTSRPTPKVADWVFSPGNDRLFGPAFAGLPPSEWARRGKDQINRVLVKENYLSPRSGEP